jgi:hypothetical protein
MGFRVKSDKPPDPNRALTIEEFCWLENFSVYTYQKIRRLGYGPEEERVPGTDVIRITPESRAAYHERLRSKEVKELIDKERERRAVFAKAQGKEAAKSEKHIANVRRAKSAANAPIGKIKKTAQAAE